MTKQLLGKPVADVLRQSLREEIREIKAQGGKTPTLAILRVGDKKDDIAYEERLKKNCLEMELDCRSVSLPEAAPQETFLATLDALNKDDDVHGILVLRPLPETIDSRLVSRAIDPSKDVDGMSFENTARICSGDTSALAPCTAVAVIEILRHYEPSLQGKEIVLVNRSMVLGKPLAMLLLNENATVTVCHSKTADLSAVTRRAEIVVTGVGRPGFFDESYFAPDAVVIDVGINFDDQGMCGDVVRGLGTVAAVTPVPGGVGTVTSVVLLHNVLRAMKLQNGGRY
ncbi:MAG: bifunctional 5,10-methylene-tetrahydrofolate dehydrogenase/5,10-methylene-tetrahydrofolate cyclohydrolase [Firmicutes bacterium HGW-Firmicutes-11]|jgi:methylenetetrahydrofolate dehydrogenase (NADP+)/methenyltetrahydrofolate cyclohydrolase|nr:MAG: bifunctional 5,10-methylene-tetrahydrofolate dehydrogenase/5,10-methylene-tetrahydrofolate cyclohydrolase [Firmicutes bacterium HGW-Firmicutes-11]